MEDDLDWLARNVHVWPAGDHQPWCYVYWKGGQRSVSGNCITVIQPCVRVEMSDWLARRAELQNKPSWGSIGSDINFISQHEDGQWIGHSEKPDEGDECFECDCIISLFGYGEVLGDWRDTLERRPNMRKSEPKIDTSAERVQKTAESMHVRARGNDWFERGELPPVGVVCEYTGSLEGSEFAPPAGTHVTVVAHHRFDHSAESVAVFAWFFHEENCGVYIGPSQCFRPIRTERQLTVDEMMAVAAANFGNLETCCEALYDAGYRKQISPAK